MATDPITVFGGSGFLGRQVVSALVRRGLAVRVAVRHPPPAARGEAATVESLRADVLSEDDVRAAVSGAGAVVNVVGHYVQRRGASFDDVHVRGAERVARLAAAAGVERLVHLSGIGVDAASPSPYVRARAAGEARVRERFVHATVLRPSALFGVGDALLTALDAITRLAPVFPLLGSGNVRLQPIHVGDVAEAVSRALQDVAARGRTYELGGPTVYTYRELVRLVLEHRGRRRILLPLPLPIWTLGASVLGVLPSAPLTRDQVVLMSRDNVAAATLPGCGDLGITPRSIPELLDEVLAAPS